MKGVLKVLGATGSLGFVVVMWAFSGLILPHLTDTGKVIFLAVILLSAVIGAVMHEEHEKAVERHGRWAVFHPLTFVMISFVSLFVVLSRL